jgi:hypothetical protein
LTKRGALLFVTLLGSLFASQAAAEKLALDVDAMKVSIFPTNQKAMLTITLTPESEAAAAEFNRLRCDKPITVRLGDEPLIMSIDGGMIIEGKIKIGGDLTYRVVRQMKRDIESGKRTLFLEGSDK